MEKFWGYLVSGFGLMLLGLSLLFLPLQACAQVNKDPGGVAEVPVLRNILLEEFTAIHCSYCPSGHAIAQSLHHALGERLQTIAVHVSDLARPGGTEVDLRSAFGEDWYAMQGKGGMPSGAINRHRFEDFAYGSSYALGRADWAEAARSLLHDTATVNLYAEAELDIRTRELNVRVEYFYPRRPTDNFQMLTVALTENYVRGTQTGATAGNQYLHRHVLCDLLTDVYGDTIRELPSGTVVEKNYKLTLPEQYGNRAPAFENLEIIVFMSGENGEVLNSTAARVMYEDRYAAPQVSLSAPALTKYYSRTSIPVRIENLGTDTVKSVHFSIEWGKETYTPEVGALAIPYGEEQEVEIPLGNYPFSKVVKYRITADKVNGTESQSNTVADYISEPLTADAEEVTISLTTDLHGEDITWFLKNRAGEILTQGGPYESGKVQTVSVDWALEKGGVYSFEIRDAFGDGFEGGYSITDAGGNQIASARSVGLYGATVSFMRPEDAASENLQAVSDGEPGINMSHNPVPATRPANELTFDGFDSGLLDMEVFDIQGKVVFRTKVPVQSPNKSTYRLDTQAFRPGFYFIKVGLDGKAAVEKMVVQ